MPKFALLTLLFAMSFISYGQTTIESKKQLFYTAKDSTIFDVLTKKATLYGEVELVLKDLHVKGAVIEIDFLNNQIVAKSSPQHPSSPSGYNNNIGNLQAEAIHIITNLEGYSLFPVPAQSKKE